jgi:predicted transcriptional regulator
VSEELADIQIPVPAERRGTPGHDTATDRANAIRLLTLRAARMTYAQIAEEMGYSDGSAARHALMRALDRHEAENVVQLRQLENLALDTDERAIRAIISDTNLKPEQRIRAVDARTRLSARRSRMNGLDAPVKVEVSASIQQELQAALEEYLSAARGVETVTGEVTEVHDERE